MIQSVKKTPVLKIARIAGQYAKPRSDTHEIVNGGTVNQSCKILISILERIPVYRGDIVNNIDSARREPDPSRISEAYLRSLATL
jgi:3-deoxy-7-phosphoheptulonate synthase